MASVISSFFRKLSPLSVAVNRQNEITEVPTELKKWENIYLEILKIVTWKNPFLSCCCIISVNILFWLIIYLDFKFYGILFTTILILSLEQLWMDHISALLYKKNSESHNVNVTSSSSRTSDTSSVNITKISDCLKNTYNEAMLLRQSQPGMFCLFTCLGFLILNIIGKSLSGISSFYILLMLTMTVPGALTHFLPPYVISSFSNFIYSSHKEKDDNEINDEVEPYLPEINQETLELLKLAGDLHHPNKEDDEESNDLLLERISSCASDTTESLCSKLSFYPESTLMPSPENSMDFLEFDLPSNRTQEQEHEIHGINFQSKHFDKDSSDEEFIQGLSPTEKDVRKDYDEQTNVNSATASLNSEKLASKEMPLLTTIMKTKNERESSSDTDSFEMISEEDM